MRSLNDTELLLSSVLFLAVLLLASLPGTTFFLERVLADFQWLLRRLW